MGLASLASTLYSIQSRKNVPLRTAFSMMVREDLATRFSVFNLVKTVTKSEFLATVAHAKYGKKTPLQRQEEKEKEKERLIQEKKEERTRRFEQFTAASIGALKRRVDLLASITEKNNQLINSIYNDIGYSKKQRKLNKFKNNKEKLKKKRKKLRLRPKRKLLKLPKRRLKKIKKRKMQTRPSKRRIKNR